jgi:hypothetical protein
VKSVGRRFDERREAGRGPSKPAATAAEIGPPPRVLRVFFHADDDELWLRMPSSARPAPDLRDGGRDEALTIPRRLRNEIRCASIPRGPRQGWGAYTGDVTTIRTSRTVWIYTMLCRPT